MGEAKFGHAARNWGSPGGRVESIHVNVQKTAGAIEVHQIHQLFEIMANPFPVFRIEVVLPKPIETFFDDFAVAIGAGTGSQRRRLKIIGSLVDLFG